ncbi:MAG: TonB-dependent receptor [Bacteroidales bacterium]|nr:TonB-dependent receptor [Bacteroidales bacterium]MBQ8811010.1 TonB-dependent receptor [Bacteroidales bacterium]
MKKYLKLILAIMLSIVAGNGLMAQNPVRVSGIVTSADDGLPMIGVAVMAGPGNGVITSVDGDYEIVVSPGTELVFSSIGFNDVNIVVPAVENFIHNVTMHPESMKLDDAVVIAYGVRKKGTVAGSVSTVKADKLENTPTAAFDQALQGQVAGLTVLSSTGEPSASATMTIRGTNSINSGTAPLYILDGVAISASDFNTINPADIESMSVLKDASSTSIYGARAANGVIVITTKRGRDMERPNVNYRMQMGLSALAHGNWDLMNTSERIQYEKELGLTAGQNYDFLSKTDVNWMNAVFNDSAMLQSHELSVSGATETTNYYFSGGYYDQEGIAPGSEFTRYSMRFNFEQQMAKWLKMGTNTMLNYQKIRQADEGAYTLVTPISAARFMLPYWNPFKSDGSLASINDGTWSGSGQNPLEWLENNPLSYNKYKLFSTVFAELTLYRNLVFKSQFGVDFSHTTGFSQSFPDYKPNQGEGSAARSSSDGLNLQLSNTLNYRFDIDNIHDFNFLLGHEWQDYHLEAFSVSTAGQNNSLLTDISTGTRATSWTSTSASDYSRVSFFGRAEYDFADKYYAEVSVRTDGSSRFGANNRWGLFGAVGFMWNLRNEDFMSSSRNWLTTAQVAVSSGTSGNSEIPNYEHLALIGGGADYVGDAGVAPVQPGNEDLTWENTWTSNIALHFGFWSRLNVDLEFYNKKTTDMLMSVPLAYSQSNGYGYRWSNVGAMVNRGVELNVNAVVFQLKDFIWSVNANVGYNHNRLIELYNGVDEYETSNTSTKLVVGHPVGEFYINRYAGVNPANGDALWYDKDGNITNELRDEDKVMVGKTYHAPWQGGFGTSLSWKGLSLSAQFSWVGDRWMLNNDRYFDESNGRFMTYNQSRRLLNRWKQPGDITDIPRHGEYTEFDSRLLEDASFLRLKNLMFSYSLPSDLLRKTGFIRGLRVYVQGQNLLTFTNFSGLDPEGVANLYAAQYPMSRQYTFGLDLLF